MRVQNSFGLKRWSSGQQWGGDLVFIVFKRCGTLALTSQCAEKILGELDDFPDERLAFAFTVELGSPLGKRKAPVAQLDRASDYGSEGFKFES